MAELPVTRWRITEVPGRTDINVLLILDTVDPSIVEWIERGAREGGVDMHRLTEDE